MNRNCVLKVGVIIGQFCSGKGTWRYLSGNSSMFDSRMERITQQDKEQMLADGLPWEGIGCWHPVFPALGCDMYLAATSAVEMLIQLIARGKEGSHNYILQKKYGMDGLFAGYERI